MTHNGEYGGGHLFQLRDLHCIGVLSIGEGFVTPQSKYRVKYRLQTIYMGYYTEDQGRATEYKQYTRATTEDQDGPQNTVDKGDHFITSLANYYTIRNRIEKIIQLILATKFDDE